MDVSQYLEIFIDETKEHLQSLNEQLLVLEKEPENNETINEIFRAAHSLKGMAGTMGYKRMQRLTHDMENVFSEIRGGKMKVTDGLVDILFRGLDALEGYLEMIQNTAGEGENDNEDIIQGLNRILQEGLGEEPKKEEKPAEKAKNAETSMELRTLSLGEYDINAVNRGKEAGQNVFSITIYIAESCILKAARAFLVFKTLDELGDVIKSVPEVTELENEQFDLDFSVLLVTEFPEEHVKSAIENVSEVHKVCIGRMEIQQEKEKQAAAQTKSGAAGKSSAAGAKKPSAASAEQAGKNPAAKSAKPVVNRSVRVDIEKLDGLMNLVSELIIAKNGLVSLSREDSAHENTGFNEQIEYLETVTTNLHETVMKVRMVPIESVVNKFPRMIRDLSKKLNKKMELYMTGEDTELDRTVVDEIGDPLMHLLRNSADHGLESNEERIRAEKPEVGSIYLDAYQDGNNVVIAVRDDGAGINVDRVKQKAVEKGVITEEQSVSMSDKEAIDLLFLPSFSTADKISDVSGRGVGLDVVKTKIEALGGDIEAKTVRGEGSSFVIRLPLTLAIIQTLMVELGDEKYAIPLGSIQTIEDVNVQDIKYVQGKEVIHLRGSVVPLIRLDKLLDVPKKETSETTLTAVIVTKGEKIAGLVVDNLIGQQEIVIKPIGRYINSNKMIGGATILGDGEVALILDANALV